MSEAVRRVPSAMYRLVEHSREFLSDRERRDRNNLIAAAIITLLLGVIYLVANGNVALPLAPVAVAAILIVLWSYPDALLPMVVAAVCLIEEQPLGFKDSVTDKIPLFWDFNTIVQTYYHKDFHGFALNPFEVILIIAAVFTIVRGVYERTFQFRAGVLLAPMAAYLVCVFFGLAHGITTGGDYHIGLFEVRSQVYIVIAYIIAMNASRDPQQTARSAMWIAAICIAIKGLLLTFRFFVTLGGHTVPELGVGAHDESYFFNAYLVLWFCLKMANLEPKMRSFLLIFMPFVLIANLANERRAATAANLIAIPALLFLCYRAFPKRRKFILAFTSGLCAFAAVYLPIFWNSDGVLAQPARAIHSHFSADPRDASSDVYRMNEDADLMYTMRLSPIIGYGYGKQFQMVVPLPNLTNVDPLILFLPHDQILWIWMRLGWVGFFVFWIMACHFLIRTSQTASDTELNPFARTVGVYAAVLVVSLIMFGLLDLQLSSARDMLFTGLWLGIVAAIVRQRDDEIEVRRLVQLSAFQRKVAAMAAGNYRRGFDSSPTTVPVHVSQVIEAEERDKLLGIVRRPRGGRFGPPSQR